MPLDRETLNELVDILTPLMKDELSRRALLTRAFIGNPILDQINYSGSSRTFATELISQLVNYGEIAPGKSALWALLEVVYSNVGLDKRARIEALDDKVNVPSEPIEPIAKTGMGAQAITWLHLSDFHFRESTAYDADVVLSALLDDINNRIREDQVRPDFILFSGDIAFSGQPTEYRIARQFFDSLLQTTNLNKSALFIVPGNHDVNRKEINFGAQAIADTISNQGDKEAFRTVTRSALDDPATRSLLFKRLQNYGDFVNQYFEGHLKHDPENYFYTRVVRHEQTGQQIAILGLNSAWLCGSDKDKNRILLGERQVREALVQAKGADIKIALLHHPFSWLHELDTWDVEPMLTDQCNFILCGHTHWTSLTQLTDPVNSAMRLVAGAGYERRSKGNRYNYVKLNLEKKEGTVFLRMYSDARGGFWTEDVVTYPNTPGGKYTFKLTLTKRPSAQSAIPIPAPQGIVVIPAPASAGASAHIGGVSISGEPRSSQTSTSQVTLTTFFESLIRQIDYCEKLFTKHAQTETSELIYGLREIDYESREWLSLLSQLDDKEDTLLPTTDFKSITNIIINFQVKITAIQSYLEREEDKAKARISDQWCKMVIEILDFTRDQKKLVRQLQKHLTQSNTPAVS
ncbi:MAG: metallophosphoesterase [Anaerolineae bacterium]|nr:metallophosphoesterase [Anaerolineae bacterium]